MAEQSFPMLEQPMSDQQWGQVTLGIGNGVLNEGGDPYRISSLDNAANTITIAVSAQTGLAQAVVSGFYHRIDEPMVLEVPAVTAPTAYQVVLEYSPVRATEGGLPVVMKVVTGLDYSQGREFLVLHTIDRAPNQLLTDAARRSVKPRVAPLLQVREEAELPDPASVLRGTVAMIHGDFPDIRIAKTEPGQPLAWASLMSGAWTTLSDHANTASFSGSPKQFKRSGKTRYLRGQFYRPSGAYTTSSQGYIVANLASEDIPRRGMRFPVVPVVHGTGAGADADAYIAVSAANSEVRLYLTRGTCGRIDMGQINYDVD